MGMFSKFFEDLGGPKMGDAARMHDPEELKKWKERSEKTYGRFGKRRDKYSGRADKEYGRYGRSRGEAQRLYGRAESATGRAEGGISDAAFREKRAGELADDRQHYAGLRERAEGRRKKREGFGLELESKQRDHGSFDAVQAMVMDAAKMGNDAYMAQTEAISAGLAKTNPVAAAKLMLDASSNAATNLGKAKQQGWFTGQEKRLQEFSMAAQKIGMQTSLLGDDEQADRYLSEARGQQIQEQMGLSTAALNRSGANLNMADRYSQIGRDQAGLAATSLGASQQYDEFGNEMLTEEASIEEQRMGREQELMLSDQMAQQQVDEYNAGRMGRGIQTGLSIAETGMNMYTGGMAGLASSQEADMYGRMALGVGGDLAKNELGKNYAGSGQRPDGRATFVSSKGDAIRRQGQGGQEERRFGKRRGRSLSKGGGGGMGQGFGLRDIGGSFGRSRGGTMNQGKGGERGNRSLQVQGSGPGTMSPQLGSGRLPVTGWSYQNEFGQMSKGSQGKTRTGATDWNYDDPRNINPYGRQYIPKK